VRAQLAAVAAVLRQVHVRQLRGLDLVLLQGAAVGASRLLLLLEELLRGHGGLTATPRRRGSAVVVHVGVE
jgi:hypothetical protein